MNTPTNYLLKLRKMSFLELEREERTLRTELTAARKLDGPRAVTIRTILKLKIDLVTETINNTFNQRPRP